MIIDLFDDKDQHKINDVPHVYIYRNVQVVYLQVKLLLFLCKKFSGS